MSKTQGAEVVFDAVRFAWPGGAQMAFDCTFEAGKITALMGASGSGKSTLLSLLAGFERPDSGSIRIGSVDVTDAMPADRPVSMVFQDHNVFDHLDVFSNVALGVSPSLRLDDPKRAQVTGALEAVGLGQYAHKKPGALSGGERQRVALARVLVRDRPVLLLDEAFGSLGPGLRDAMLDLVADLARKRAMTTIMISHDPDDARRIADAIAFVDKGTIVAQGPVADVLDGPTRHDAVTAYLGAAGR